MDTGNGNMEGVRRCLRWQCLLGDQRYDGLNSRISHGQERKRGEYGHTPLRSVWITSSCFLQYDLRRE